MENLRKGAISPERVMKGNVLREEMQCAQDQVKELSSSTGQRQIHEVTDTVQELYKKTKMQSFILSRAISHFFCSDAMEILHKVQK